MARANSCVHCAEHLDGCHMVECARCGQVLCRKDNGIVHVDGVGGVCDECYFDICEARDNAE